MSEEVLSAYDAWAATYDSIDNPMIAQASAVLDERAAWFRGARVLELGCGTGRNALFALQHGAASYVGVDGSRGMLDVARARVPGATFLEGPLLPPPDAQFDLVLICLVLEHLRDVDFAPAAAALAPGGRLLVLELHASLHAAGVGANFRVGDREVRVASFAHDAAELRAAADRAGLEEIVCIDHIPSAAALAKSPKLARYTGRPVLIELAARKTSC